LLGSAALAHMALLLRSPAKSHAPRMHATRSELPEHSPGGRRVRSSPCLAGCG
jgi:hypothetical protein